MNSRQKNEEDDIYELIGKFGEVGMPLRFAVKALKEQKKSSRGYRRWFKRSLVNSEIILVLASAAATATVAVGYQIEWLAIWAILPTSIVTIVSGVAAIFDFRGGYVRHWRMSSELAELESKLIFDLKLAIAANHSDQIDGRSVAEYAEGMFKKVADIMRNNIDEVGRSMIANK